MIDGLMMMESLLGGDGSVGCFVPGVVRRGRGS